MLNRFVGIVTHDLRNPLGAMQVFSEMLLEDKDMSEDEKLTCLSKLNKICKSSLYMVNDLFNISAIR